MNAWLSPAIAGRVTPELVHELVERMLAMCDAARGNDELLVSAATGSTATIQLLARIAENHALLLDRLACANVAPAAVDAAIAGAEKLRDRACVLDALSLDLCAVSGRGGFA